ncbi:response regulator [Stutzerimonas tarimensis]|uniref:histidine kinase n=1 Tax=Stutzerimonas tarimensis TaxID=1507735 RepID=A0ABV7TB74_9GAMM
MLKDLGIRGRILILTLLPSLLLAVVLGTYFTRIQLQEIREQLLERGEMIAEQLAPLLAQGFADADERRLQRILNGVLNQPDVRTVTALDAERNLLGHAGPDMRTSPPPSDPLALTRVSGDETTRILMPVLMRDLYLAEDLNGSNLELIGWLELELSHKGTLLRGYRTLLATLLLISVALVVTGLLAVRLSRAISQPLQRIKAAVAQLKDGHLETRLPPLGNQEMDELGSGINRMAEALLSGREELQQSIDQATEDVHQNLETIEIQNIELDLARKEALEASRIKSEFLANISHEIRTPLNGILGFTHLLQKSDLTPRQYDYLSTIEKSAGNLLAIINEILDFSKIEAGKLMLESIPFNLRDLIEDTLTILAPSAHAKRLELVCLIYRDTPLQLVGDPLRLKQVLTNLVSNAIKFTPEGSIVVRAMLEEDHGDSAQLRLSVKDTGVGLSEREIRALFQAFSQADNSLSRQPGGTGLGLVISKRLIEQMGGEIGVDSAPDEGSEFWISLTLPRARDDIEDRPPMSLIGRRAALIESHPLARQALQHQLEDLGLEVVPFADLESLKAWVAAGRHGSAALDYALICVDPDDLSPEEQAHLLQELDGMGTKCLLVCPTLEHGPQLPQDYPSRVLAKPMCSRQLQRALLDAGGPAQIAAPDVPAPPGRAPRILCVDDNEANLLLVQTLLSDMGAEVLAVDNGEAALALVKSSELDLVFMDMQMPGMDGRQTTEAIRQWEAEHDREPLPVIALTAHALSNEKRAVLRCGLDDYLTKPIGERQLAQVVLKWTGLALRHNALPEPPPADPTLPILDPEESLRLAANKPDLAKDMLGMLLASLDADRIAIDRAREVGDRQALIDRVHRLHGATRYVGVPQLRAACQRSETLLKQDHAAVDTALDALIEAIDRLQCQAQAVPAS